MAKRKGVATALKSCKSGKKALKSLSAQLSFEVFPRGTVESVERLKHAVIFLLEFLGNVSLWSNIAWCVTW